MAQEFNFQSVDYKETDGAVGIVAAQTEIPAATVVLVRARVVVTRISDGASKAWSFESLLRRYSGGNVTALETIPAALNLFATAGDETALSGVSIALSSDATHMGILCTGLAATVMAWSLYLEGRGMTNS